MGKLAPDHSDTDLYVAWLYEAGYSKVAVIGADRWAGIRRLLFHWTMHIGQIGDMIGYDDRYCFQIQSIAERALDEWESRNFEGEPVGWHRHVDSGRRRPGGDPRSEYING